MSKGSELLRRGDKLFRSTERSNVESQWSLLSEFMLNNQSGNFQGEDTPGGKKTDRVFDSTAMQATHDLSAAIHATLTNPATTWSKIRYKAEDLNNNAEAVSWLESVNDRIHAAFNESNFDTQVSKAYQSYPSLGTMALLHDQEEPTLEGFGGFRFQALHLSEIAIAENSKGLIDMVFRKFKLTARQAVEKFDIKKLDETIVEAAMEDPTKEFPFMHCVFPRDEKDVQLNELGQASGENRPIASVYIDTKSREIVEETGYYEFPMYVVRWNSMPGEVYGRGPGHIALPDVRTLNRVKELGLHAINKAINPPMLATQRGILGSLDLRPGGITIVRDPNGVKEFQTQARFDVTNFAVEDLRQSIGKIFFLDKLTLPPRTETGEMTAFEISRRVEEMQKVLGPTLGRLNAEFLTPLVVRAFKMLLRGGALPPVPAILQERGIDIKITFVNQLARSQKIEDVSNIQAWTQDLMLLAQDKPEALDYIDLDGIAKHTAQIRGVPEAAIANDDEVQAIRQQRAQQQQQQQALDSATQIADVAAKTGGLGEE
jgi:hypothetical protein